MSPRSSEQYEKIRKDRKNDILEAALKLFGSRGFAHTSISLIAKEAGISKGLMYNYFESKESLLHGVVEQINEETMLLFADILALEDPNEVMRLIITKSVAYVKDKREYNTLLTSLAMQKEIHSFIQDFADRKMAEMMPFFENLLSQLGFENPQEEALFFGAVMDGMSVQYLTTENENNLDKMQQILLKKYTNEKS